MSKDERSNSKHKVIYVRAPPPGPLRLGVVPLTGYRGMSHALFFRLRESSNPRLWDTSVPIISETSEGCQSGWADNMLPLPAAQTYEEGLLPETGIPMFGIGAVLVSCGTGAATVGFSIP